MIQLHIYKTTKPLRFQRQTTEFRAGQNLEVHEGNGKTAAVPQGTEKAKNEVLSFQKSTNSKVQRLMLRRTRQNLTRPDERWPDYVAYIRKTEPENPWGAPEAELDKGQ